MNNFLDHYCERVTPQLWDEPLNFLTNAAFLIVAFMVLRRLRKLPQAHQNHLWDFWLLTGLIIAVGVGSSIWHLLATSWALWADRIPILLFISLFLVSCLVRIFKLSILLALTLLVLFAVLNIVIQFQFPPATLNGSLFYTPTLMFLFVMTFVVSNRKLFIRKYFTTASILFSIAIAFRTIDLVACDTIPTGTHFIWHILIATTIYSLMTALIQSATSKDTHEK